MIRMLQGLKHGSRLAAFLATPGLLVATVWISSFQVLALAAADKEVEITVDATSGLDTNLGTPDRPVKTVSQAAQMALFNRRQGVSTKITIRPGIYREFVQIASVGPELGASITFQASQTGAAVLSGSDLWTDWQPDVADGQIYIHPWQYRWGPCEHPRGWPAIKEIGLRREMIFVNGTSMIQALSRNEMREGTFFVDEANGVVSLWPPPGTNLSAAKVEVAVRPGVFESDGVSNLSLKGLVFEHANSCHSSKPNAAVIISGGANNSVEDTAILWNNWIGFDYWSSQNSMAKKLTVNWNGELGINGYGLKNATFENVETSHNNWRGAQGQFTTWEPSGGKFLRVHDATFRNYIAVDNQGRGMWFDTDNVDITIDHSFIEQNLVAGIDLEANMGPFTIQNSRICGNRGDGIQNNQTQNVTLTDTVIYNNGKAQILAADIQAPRQAVNWETKQPFSATSDNWVISHDTIVGTSAKQLVYGTLRLPNQVTGTFLGTLKSDNNTWFNSETPDSFQLDPGASDRPAKILSFVQWQSTTGQDKQSKFAAPAADLTALCALP